eukprot:1577626-Ditylum_brightwellii.AAC.1
MIIEHHANHPDKDLGISVLVNIKPKGHPELDGESINLYEVNSKIYVNNVPLGKRRSVEKFHQQI